MSDYSLFRAVYTDEYGRTHRRTFAARDQQAAGGQAEKLKLPGETLSELRTLRPLSRQLTLESCGGEPKPS
jgi:hypothetical protein